MRLFRAARFHSPGSRFFTGGFLWISGKVEDRSLQAGAGQKVLVASLAQRTGIGFPSSGSKLFSGNYFQNAKAAGRLGPLSLDLSSPIHEEGMCKRGSFTVHGSVDPQLLTSRLWPFKYVSGLGRGASPWPSAPSGSTQPPPCQQTEGGETGPSGLGVCVRETSGIRGGWRLELSLFHGGAIWEGAFEESELVEDVDEQT